MTHDNSQKTQLMAWSGIYKDAAEVLIHQAHADFTAGNITAAEYNDLFERQYRMLLQAAANLNNAAFTQLAKLAEADLKPIESATTKLKAAIDTIDKVQKAVNLTEKLLTTVGLVAAAVMDPTKASVLGAAQEVESFTEHLMAAVSSTKE